MKQSFTRCLLQLDKLKRSYHKLQRKQLKDTSRGANTKETDLSEVTRLSEKIEVQYNAPFFTYTLSYTAIYW